MNWESRYGGVRRMLLDQAAQNSRYDQPTAADNAKDAEKNFQTALSIKQSGVNAYSPATHDSSYYQELERKWKSGGSLTDLERNELLEWQRRNGGGTLGTINYYQQVRPAGPSAVPSSTF